MTSPGNEIEETTVPMYLLVADKFARKGGRKVALIICDYPYESPCDPALWRNMVHTSKEDKIKVFNACTNELPSMEDLQNSFEAVVVMGSRTMIHDEEDWIPGLLKFIQEVYTKTKVKLVGGCFGHQAIAVALGGRDCVKRNRIGKYCLTIEDVQTVTRREPYRLVESHGDEVIKLPPGAELLATSKTASNEIFTIDDRVLSFQCHPEIPRSGALFIADRVEELGLDCTPNSREIFRTKPIDQLQFLEDILYPFLDEKPIKKGKL